MQVLEQTNPEALWDLDGNLQSETTRVKRHKKNLKSDPVYSAKVVSTETKEVKKKTSKSSKKTVKQDEDFVTRAEAKKLYEELDKKLDAVDKGLATLADLVGQLVKENSGDGK